MFLLAIGAEINVLLVTSCLILLLGILLKRFSQPYILAYILAGVITGPQGLGIVSDITLVQNLGDIGLIILMFFIGMHISMKDMIARWKEIFIATFVQIIVSVGVMFLLGYFFQWPFNRSFLLGLVISLSSSAVVMRLTENLGKHQQRLQRGVVGVLIAQDIMVIPMIISINVFAGGEVDGLQIAKQVVGAIIILVLLALIYRKREIRLPFAQKINGDHELELFAALIVCFGFALFTSLFDLSAGLGALVSGVIVNNSGRSSQWLHDNLDSFRILLISAFFLSVGMLIDLEFLKANWPIILLVTVAVYVSNHGINSAGLRLAGNTWRDSILGGAMLAQIGEFSFVLTTTGYQLGLIGDYGYQVVMITIAFTIMLSPIYVTFNKMLVKGKSD